MSLVPYKITALKRLDSTGLNIIPYATVAITNISGYAQIWTDSTGATPISNPFSCDINGEKELWIDGGSYGISVTGGQSWNVEINGGSDVTSVQTFADLLLKTASVNQIIKIAGHTTAGIGGGDFVAKSGSVTSDGGTQINSATTGVYWQRLFLDSHISIYDFGAVPGGDITTALQLAVDSSPGTHDLTTAYIYQPSWVIDIPYGNFTLSSRVLVTKNNIIIRGAGMFNTNIKGPAGAQMNEMIRFRGAYACGILNLTLDGGLPFVVTGSEIYGVDIPLVTDQCAHFQMDQVNLCNYRVRGWQCIHLWESNIGEVRCFNGGYFAVAAGVAPYGIAFDAFRKEDTTYSGSESNQIYIAKYAFSCPGGVVSFDSPCFNIQIGQIVAEGRTYSWVPSGMGTAKFYYSGLSSLCVIKQAWCYFHEQTSACNSILIESSNAGPACSLDDIFVYQELTDAAKFLEVVSIFKNSSAHTLKANISIQDVGGVGGLTSLFDSSSSGSIVCGDLEYRNLTVRTLDNFVGSVGTTNYMGKIIFSVGAFAGQKPTVYNFKGPEVDVSAIDGSGIFNEYKCRAWVAFNGTTGAIIGTARNISSVVRNSSGNYTVTFSTALPSDYAPYANCNASATGAERAYIAGYTSSNMNVIVAAGASVADATVVTAIAFR